MMMADKFSPAPTPGPVVKKVGFFENAAIWLLSRLPWFKDRYLDWSKTKRTVIGLLMYLIVLPVIPVLVGVIWYARDPEGFKRSKALPILGVITAAWLGGFGLIAMQPGANPIDTLSNTVNPTASPAPESAAKKAIQSKTASEPALGRQFENCDAAFSAGVFNIKRSDSAYRRKLDGDNDGIACEK